MSGLLDGFLEYATPTDAEYRTVLQGGLIAVDTNVLLNLYRYHPTTRQDLFRILEALEDRLFVPNQVAIEFWRNRERTIRASAEETVQLRESLESQLNRSVESLASWAERVALPTGTSEELAKYLRTSYEDIGTRVDIFSGESLSVDALDTNIDPVLGRLAVVLEGRVGKPLPVDELEVAHEEAERRIMAQEPPGFADSTKTGELRYGDYMLWRELLTEAASRQTDVLLVTGDVKEDWWRREKGETRGPRLELSREVRAVAGARLFMLRPASLLARAKDALDLAINEESVRAAETVDRLVAERRTDTSDEIERYSLEKLPDSRNGDYCETLIEMTALAQGSPSLDKYIQAFQASFPTITLRDVARRRMRVLVSLDFVQIRDESVVLTKLGQRLLEDRTLDIVQDSFMRRIAGAAEIGDMAASASIASLRGRLRDDPPDGLSATQALLVLRYMEHLDLI